MVFRFICFTLFTLCFQPLYSQTFSGIIKNQKTNLPLAYANIGIAGKNVGTVSDEEGKYTLTIGPQFDADTLLVSCIGFSSFKIRVQDFKKIQDKTIRLAERWNEIKEVVVKPVKYKAKTLGITTKSSIMQAGFKENQLGYECGVLMKVKKSAFLEKAVIRFAKCTYDTIFYRLNIYKSTGELSFENILPAPIYLKLPKSKLAQDVVIDLNKYNLYVEGDFLVTLEHVKDLGPGYLYFNVGLSGKTYYRKTSQGSWQTIPVGIGISVEASVEI